MSEQDHTALSGFNILKNVILPIKDEEQLYGDDTFKFFQDNNLDTAELVGIDKDENAGFINLDDDTNLKTQEKFSYVKDLATFIHDLPYQARYRLLLGTMNASRFLTNLAPVVTKNILTPDSPVQENIYSKAQQLDTFLKNQINQFEEGYKKSFQAATGRDPNTASDLISYVAQDFPYAYPIYNLLDKAGVPKTVSLPLSVGIGAGFAFDPKKDQSTLFFNSAAIKGLKDYFGALPNTPEGELYDRAYQIFETTGLSAFISPIVKTAQFLKRNVPAFEVQGASAATALSTGVEQALDNTINPVDENLNNPVNQNLNQEMQNQEPTILDNVKSGIDQFGNKLSEIGGAIKKEFSGEAQAAGPLVAKAQGELFKKVPVFKSAVVDAIEKIPNKAPGNQIIGTIKNVPGVSQNEIKWIGLDDFLKDKPSVTKQEISDFIQANRLDVNEVEFPRIRKGKKDLTDSEAQNEISQNFGRENFDDYQRDDIAFYFVQSRQAQKNLGGQRVDQIRVFKKSREPLADNEAYENKSVQNLLRERQVWDNFYEEGNLLELDDFEKFYSRYYTIDDLVKKKKSIPVEDWQDILETLDDSDYFIRFGSDRLDFDDLKNAIFSADEYSTLVNSLKEKNITVKGQSYITDQAEVKKLYNEYVTRVSDDKLSELGTDYDSVAEFLGSTGVVSAKYGQYTLPGGKDYKEIVFTLSRGGENLGGAIPLEQGPTKKITAVNLGLNPSKHFGVGGEFAHVRFTERRFENKRILTVEEMQSDLFQEVKGYNKDVAFNAKTRDDPSARQAFLDDKFIKDFPFKNSWYELVTRRLIRYATDRGFDGIAIPEGRIAAARYGKAGGFVDNIDVNVKTTYALDGSERVLTKEELKNNFVLSDKQIDDLVPSYYFTFKAKKGNQIIEEFSYKDGDVYNVEKIFPKSFGNFAGDLESVLLHRYTPEELKKQTFNYSFEKPEFTGQGKGKFELYDQAIPAYMKKYAKKWNAPVTKETIKIDDEDVGFVVLKLTPEMKRSVTEKSQPLFNVVLPALIGGGAGKGISDNIQNNIISDPTKN